MIGKGRPLPTVPGLKREPGQGANLRKPKYHPRQEASMPPLHLSFAPIAVSPAAVNRGPPPIQLLLILATVQEKGQYLPWNMFLRNGGLIDDWLTSWASKLWEYANMISKYLVAKTRRPSVNS